MNKTIGSVVKYLQNDLDNLARSCAKWRIKLNPEKTIVITFSRSTNAIRAEPASSLYVDFLSYYPHIKFLGITFDSRMTFVKHFEHILDHWTQKFHRLRILVNKNEEQAPTTILQIYKQCVRPIFEYGIVSTITVSDTVINKLQNSFIMLALRLPKYVSVCLLHKTSGLPYVKERLISVGQNQLARKHFEHILDHWTQKFHRLRILVNKNEEQAPTTILQIYKQCVRPIFEYGIVSTVTVTVSDTVFNKLQNSFIMLALRLPKYVSVCLLHKTSGLPYVKERLISVGQNQLARMHVNPLTEHTINSARTNIAWDKYRTPLTILKPQD